MLTDKRMYLYDKRILYFLMFKLISKNNGNIPDEQLFHPVTCYIHIIFYFHVRFQHVTKHFNSI